MSWSLLDAPLRGQESDAFKYMKEWQDILNQPVQRGLTQAQTGLTQEQTVGQQINNQLGRLGLQYKTNVLGQLTSPQQDVPPPTAPPGYTPDAGGGSIPSGGTSAGGGKGIGSGPNDTPGVTGAQRMNGTASVTTPPSPYMLAYATSRSGVADPTLQQQQVGYAPAAPQGGNALALANGARGPSPLDSGNIFLGTTSTADANGAPGGGVPISGVGGAVPVTGQPTLPPGAVQVAQAGPPGAVPSQGPPGPPGVPQGPQGGPQGPQQGGPPGQQQRVAAYMAQPSANGVVIPGVGAVPKTYAGMYQMDIVDSKDGGLAAAERLKTIRYGRLTQLAQSATTPQEWNMAVFQAYREGWMTAGDYFTYFNRPQLQESLIRSMQNANQIATQNLDMFGKGFVWDGSKWVVSRTATSVMPPQEGPTVEVPGKGYVQTKQPPGANAPASTEGGGGPGAAVTPGGGGPAAAPPAAPAPAQPPPAAGGGAGGAGTGGATGGAGASVQPPPPPPGGAASGNPMVAYAAALAGHEGGGVGVQNAAGSGASGVYQWMPETMAAMRAKYAPGSGTPSAGDENKMLAGFTAENAVRLQQAGLTPNGANLFLSHWVGPGGVRALANAPLNASLAQVLPASFFPKNPLLQAGANGPTTVGGLINYAQQRFGTTPITADNIQAFANAGAAPGGGGPAPAAAPVTRTAAGGGPALAPGAFPTSAPEVPAVVTQRRTIEVPLREADNTAVSNAQQAQADYQQLKPTILDARASVPDLQSGSGSQWRLAADNFLATFGLQGTDAGKWLQDHGIVDLDSVGMRQKFAKEALTLIQANAQRLGVTHPGIGITDFIAKSSPNLDMQPDAIREMLNMYLVMGQMTNDYADGLNDKVTGFQQQYADDYNLKYVPQARQYQQDWAAKGSIHAPEVYRAAMLILNGKDANQWGANLSEPQFTEAREIARRADPYLALTPGQMFRMPTANAR